MKSIKRKLGEVLLLLLGLLFIGIGGQNNKNKRIELELNNSTLYLQGDGAFYKVVFRASDTVFEGEQKEDLISEITWRIDREEAQSFYGAKEENGHVYTGDALLNWRTWDYGGIGGRPLFTVQGETVEKTEDGYEITLEFSQAPFRDESTEEPEYMAFVGEYSFGVYYKEKMLIQVPFFVKLYEGSSAGLDLQKYLEEEKRQSKNKGIYFEVGSYGQSEGGNEQLYVVLAKDEKFVEQYLENTNTALKNPTELQKKLSASEGNFPLVVMLNNIHPNERVGVDAQLKILSRFLEEEKKPDLLEHIILVCALTQNPDGHYTELRKNENGFDLNLDEMNQTQKETQNFAQFLNKWNPAVYLELHGYADKLLIEPCTPPHEPNTEYDLVAENMIKAAEAFGEAASAMYTRESLTGEEYYEIPLRDYFSEQIGRWKVWTDMDGNVGSTFAMINCGAMGITVEAPEFSALGRDVLVEGFFGMAEYVRKNKVEIYNNQIEFFKRGMENVDASEKMAAWITDIHNEKLPVENWRPIYEENQKFFPEYYVIPLDGEHQKNLADAYETGEYLIRNGVEIRLLTEDTEVEKGIVYPKGSLIIDMKQAKRNMANAVLWEGYDVSRLGFEGEKFSPWVCFPKSNDFECKEITKEQIFEGKLSEPVETIEKKGHLETDAGDEFPFVILYNNGREAIKAVNAMLSKNVVVGMLTEENEKDVGNFIISKKDYDIWSQEYVLQAKTVKEMPIAHKLNAPKLWITGKKEDYENHKITGGYYRDWFCEGILHKDYETLYQSRNYYYNVFFYKQMGFEIVADFQESNPRVVRIDGEEKRKIGRYKKSDILSVFSQCMEKERLSEMDFNFSDGLED